MSNVMSLKSFQNNVKRNGFDLSYKNAFTAKAGELLPVSVIECIPGDKFKISSKSLTRTQPLNSAAFVRMREYYDVFFVPYRLLWSSYPTFFTNMQDQHHASTIQTSYATCDMHPWFSFNDVTSYLGAVSQHGTDSKNFFGYDRATLTKKLLDLLGYGRDWTDDARIENTVFNPNPLLAYQKIYQDFFRDDQWESAAPYTYNLDYITAGDNEPALHIPTSQVNLNQPTLFDLRYCNFAKDYFMGMLPSAQYGSESFVAIGGDSEASRLTGQIVLGTEDSPMYYRTSGQATPGDPVQAASGFKLQFQSDQGNAPLSGLYGQGSMLLDTGTIKTGGDLYILALRQAEALQKWKEISQSGRQDYRTQMQKHFNVTPSEAMADHCRYVGGWTTNIDINEVVNTNLSTVDDQPDIRGKGVTQGYGSVSFDCKEHGILMVMYHNMPLLDYICDGYHKLNVKTHYTDYAIPEFDSLGMQQIMLGELGIISAESSSEIPTGIGYVPRYAEYKTRYDEVHGAFASSLQNWVAPLTRTWFGAYWNAVMNKYHKYMIVSDFFKVNPSILDNLFGVNADASVDTDQFLVNCFMDIKAVRNIDYNGLPY